MTITAVASLAQSAVPGLGARKAEPAYGLAFRFTAKIDGLDLGAWQSCAGLKVDFKPAEMKAGGSYLGSRFLPGELVYPKVVLKRAALKQDSQKVQDWLQDHAHKWVSGEANDETGGTGVITLFDSNDEPVMWWQLSGVRPAAWSGPDLEATNSKVAIETLELVHGGFQVGTGAPPAGAAAAGATARPLELKGTGGTVTFKFPPTEIVLQKTQQQPGIVHQPQVSTGGQTSQSGGEVLEANTNRANITTYKLNNLILFGSQTKQDVDLLTVWATRPPGSARGSDSLPPLTFDWGSGFSGVPVRLESLTVTYTRFSAVGEPIRAKVGLTLEVRLAEEDGAGAGGDHQGATNPTSGGIPGRAAHLMLQSDTLPAIAQRTYAHPRDWRAIAEANHIDDPLRVRPGTSLMLPAPQEIG